MSDIKQVLLDDAKTNFLNGDLDRFVQIIKDLYDFHITCNCFFRKQPENFWDLLNDKAEDTKDDNDNFNLNFAKGFIYLRNENEEMAFKYLSIAIELNPTCDICLSLRATVEGLEESKLIDAKEAVRINSSARNCFVLAKIFKQSLIKNGQFIYYFFGEPENNLKKFSDTIKYFDNAIFLNKNFACAYNHKGKIYVSLYDYNNAVACFTNCINIDPTHSCYYDLCYCLNKLEEYEKALYYTNLWQKNIQNDWNLYLSLGYINHHLGNYEIAIKNFELYINQSGSQNVDVLGFLDYSKKELSEQLANEAILESEKGNYENCIQIFEKGLSIVQNLSTTEFPLHGMLITKSETICLYHQAILKLHNPKIEFGENNPYYIRFQTLRNGYKNKIFKTDILTKDAENISKLMSYQSHYRIGFGIYAGLTIQEIIKLDPHYILCCVINLYHFTVSYSLFLDSNLKKDDEYLKGLEINTIKGMLLTQWRNERKEEEEFEYKLSGDVVYPSYEQWMEDEFGDDAETAFWNMD